MQNCNLLPIANIFYLVLRVRKPRHTPYGAHWAPYGRIGGPAVDEEIHREGVKTVRWWCPLSPHTRTKRSLLIRRRDTAVQICSNKNSGRGSTCARSCLQGTSPRISLSLQLSAPPMQSLYLPTGPTRTDGVTAHRCWRWHINDCWHTKVRNLPLYCKCPVSITYHGHGYGLSH